MTALHAFLIMVVWGLACWYIPRWADKAYMDYRKSRVVAGAKFENNNCRDEYIHMVEVISVENDVVTYRIIGQKKVYTSSLSEFAMNYA